jgi:hypothetical protein
MGKLAVIVATSSPEEAVLGGGMGMATFGIRRGIGYFLERRFWTTSLLFPAFRWLCHDILLPKNISERD